MLGKVRAGSAPIGRQLSASPKISVNGSRNPEDRTIVEKWQDPGLLVHQGFLLRSILRISNCPDEKHTDTDKCEVFSRHNLLSSLRDRTSRNASGEFRVGLRAITRFRKKESW